MSEEPSAQNSEEVLLFEASGDRLALLASDVLEIIRPPRMTRVPHSPPNLLGVANLRGRVLPILSLSGTAWRQAGRKLAIDARRRSERQSAARRPG